jgi:hypothetical protein
MGHKPGDWVELMLGTGLYPAPKFHKFHNRTTLASLYGNRRRRALVIASTGNENKWLLILLDGDTKLHWVYAGSTLKSLNE